MTKFQGKIGNKKISHTTRDVMPCHIPGYPCGKAEFERCHDTGYPNWGPSWFVPRWRRMIIPPNVTDEAAVYRLLPSADILEFGGWITRRCIFFAPGTRDRAYTHDSTLTVFHSHPTAASDAADMPSERDVWFFLSDSNVRSVIVGWRRIIVMEKTAQTMPVVTRFTRWYIDNLLRLKDMPGDTYDEKADVFIIHGL